MTDDFRAADEEPPPGMFDGEIRSYTPDEAAKLLGQREAEEEAFDQMLTPDGDDLPLDLNDLSIEELDQIIEMDDTGEA